MYSRRTYGAEAHLAKNDELVVVPEEEAVPVVGRLGANHYRLIMADCKNSLVLLSMRQWLF